MASTIAAITTGTGGVVTTADSSGDLSLLSGVNTVVAVTSTGATVTGTLAATGAVSGTTGTFSGAVGTAATGALTLPVGTTAQRPAGVTGMQRYNTTNGNIEFYNGTNWIWFSTSTPTTTVEYLVVAGGGGGGGYWGGGGENQLGASRFQSQHDLPKLVTIDLR